ncbi:DCC1-like thiol-disulfide oxidoreductase family protein [Prolixibacteraceae bacterium]|nr:DCC1-like thiol-disulfide oxidoreductase family protein [Prolixibacteraceae bacterium]
MDKIDCSNKWDTKQWWVFFDDECMICSFWVYIIITFEQEPRFYFGGLNTEETKVVFEEHHYAPPSDGVIFFCDNTFYCGASAIFQIAYRLKYPIKALYFFHYIPKPISDFVYRMIAIVRWRPGKDYCRTKIGLIRSRVCW